MSSEEVGKEELCKKEEEPSSSPILLLRCERPDGRAEEVLGGLREGVRRQVHGPGIKRVRMF